MQKKFSSDCHGTHQKLKIYYLRMCKIFWKVKKSWWQKSHCVYPPEMMQNSSLGRLQKKSLEHNSSLYVASISQRRILTDNILSPQNYCQINFRGLFPMYLKSIKTTLGQFFWTWTIFWPILAHWVSWALHVLHDKKHNIFELSS